jgi:hypothetical protein
MKLAFDECVSPAGITPVIEFISVFAQLPDNKADVVARSLVIERSFALWGSRINRMALSIPELDRYVFF